MILILILFFEILFCFLFNSIFTNLEHVSLLLILINTFIVLYYIPTKINDKKIAYLIFWGYILRCILMLIDFYWFKIPPHSGLDSEAFHREALKIYENINYIFQAERGLYSKFIGIIYIFLGPQRLFVQYINVILGTLIIIDLNNILKKLKIEKNSLNQILLLMIFFPHNLMFSSILLRECLVGYCLIQSLKYTVYWIENRRFYYIIFSLIGILSAASFHAGTIFFIMGLIMTFSFYSHKKQVLNVKCSTLIIFIIFMIVISYILSNNSDVFLAKFGLAQDSEYMFEWMNVTRGSSAYLTGLKIDSFKDMIIYSPIKMIYFLFSPMPWDFRGINDIISFMLDSTVYLYLIFSCIRNYKNQNDRKMKTIILILGISLFFTVLGFSYGSQNTGTALRHRNKILPSLLVLYALILKKDR